MLHFLLIILVLLSIVFIFSLFSEDWRQGILLIVGALLAIVVMIWIGKWLFLGVVLLVHEDGFKDVAILIFWIALFAFLYKVKADALGKSLWGIMDFFSRMLFFWDPSGLTGTKKEHHEKPSEEKLNNKPWGFFRYFFIFLGVGLLFLFILWRNL